tara:strand:- start:2387 stop:3451 length:1065 start_codon:yes stop_codon:yes gene_type:complete
MKNNKPFLKIENKVIDKDSPAFIVAEMSANHSGNIAIAKEIILKAKESGADAVKLQTYKAETITLDSDKQDFIIDKESPWSNYNTLYNLYDKAHTPWQWHEELFEYANKTGIIIFSAPFDDTAVDFLEELNCPAYKIASPEITDIPLIRRVARTGKPVIISTGLSNFEDLELAVKTLRNNDCNQISILKCTSTYPAPFEEINLSTLADYYEKFQCVPGLSDHTEGDEVPIASISLGAKIIEKHFVLKNDDDTADSFFSMERKSFKKMVKKIRNVENAMGVVNYSITKSALKNSHSKRSLYVSKNIKKGQAITTENIKSVRPGFGLHPKFYDEILGKKVNKNLEKGDRLNFDILE